jgi:hypothetical protein
MDELDRLLTESAIDLIAKKDAELLRLQDERGGLRAALIRLGEGAYQSEIVDTEMEESERANPYFDKDEWINDWIAEQIELEGPDILSEWPYTRAEEGRSDAN